MAPGCDWRQKIDTLVTGQSTFFNASGVYYSEIPFKFSPISWHLGPWLFTVSNDDLFRKVKGLELSRGPGMRGRMTSRRVRSDTHKVISLTYGYHEMVLYEWYNKYKYKLTYGHAKKSQKKFKVIMNGWFVPAHMAEAPHKWAGNTCVSTCVWISSECSEGVVRKCHALVVHFTELSQNGAFCSCKNHPSDCWWTRDALKPSRMVDRLMV